MRFGVNYTPSRGWFHQWLDLDLGAVRADLDDIAALGADHVRIFPLWPLLQPHRGLISAKAVDDLCAVADTAAEAGLSVAIDVLQGHLSSFDFYPAWTVTWHERNVFTDPDVVRAQADLVRTVAAAVAGRPHVLGLSLGNEPNNLVPRNPVTPEEAARWTDTLLAACEEGAPGKPLHVCNAYDAAWYSAGHPFTPSLLTGKGALSVVHPWVFSGNCARRYGPLSPQVTHLAEYAVELAKAYAGSDAVRAGRQVWVQEIGAPAPHIPAADAPAFAEQALGHLAGCEDVWGVTWWCSHDVSRDLLDFPELEYTLGLYTSGRQRKPLADVFARFASDAARTASDDTLAAPAVITPYNDNSKKRAVALVLDDTGDGTAAVTPGGDGHRPASGPGGAFFEEWMDAAARGERLAITTATQAADPAVLAARGITELKETRRP